MDVLMKIIRFDTLGYIIASFVGISNLLENNSYYLEFTLSLVLYCVICVVLMLKYQRKKYYVHLKTLNSISLYMKFHHNRLSKLAVIKLQTYRPSYICIYNIINSIAVDVVIMNKIFLILTWNHKLFTSLLSKNSGSTHIIRKVMERNGCIHAHTLCATPGSWPNTTVTMYFTHGNNAYSNTSMLSRNIKPLSIHDCSTRVSTFDSLQ